MTDEYNGWSNYETWCCHLWLTSNDEVTYRYWQNAAQEAADGLRLARRIKEEVEEAIPLDSGMFADLLRSAVDRIDWLEIARALREEVEE